MILYHGSSMAIPNPDLFHSRSKVDFGPGFYTTSLREQAEKWCQRLVRRGFTAAISSYSFAEDGMEGLLIRRFPEYSEDWLEFVFACRNGKDTSNYDIVIGGVANDRVFDTMELLFDEMIDRGVALKRLRYEKPAIQYCFRTERALSLLSFVGSETL